MKQWFNIIRFQCEIHQDLFDLARKYYLVSFLGYELIAVRILKGDILIPDLEDLEKMDASECILEESASRRGLSHESPTQNLVKTRDELILPVADGAAKLSGRDSEFREPTLGREQTVRSEDLSGELQDNSERCPPTESTDDAEARADFWSIQGDFIDRSSQ